MYQPRALCHTYPSPTQHWVCTSLGRQLRVCSSAPSLRARRYSWRPCKSAQTLPLPCAQPTPLGLGGDLAHTGLRYDRGR
eukprot:scaffold47535_cov56-Phaeocystis_antarctica.AAC.1